MVLFRSLTLGMLGACLYFLASYEAPSCPAPGPAETVVVRERPTVTVIDVAAGVSPWVLSDLVRLETDEHVRTVDDLDLGSDLAAGAAIALHAVLIHHGFIDLGVDGIHGSRRILLLLH